jgi:enoyl-CoA hydratase/carnithine racemase
MDGVASLTQNRPPVNALDLEMVERMRDLFAGLSADPPPVRSR